MKLRKIASLGLALALQVLPLSRVFVVSTSATGSSFAIVATWIAGALALMGGVDAVSGASSISVTPPAATTGVPYSGAVAYSGSHSGSARSWELRNNWSGAQAGCNTAYEIAPGLWLTNSATYLVRVGGTPTTSGTFNFTMRIWSGTGCTGGDNDTRSASITVSGGAVTAPSITSVAPPATGTVGVAYNFIVTATGTAPITFTASGLPGGVTISSAGIIAGTPTTAGTFNGTITAANGTLPNATQAFSIVISAGTVAPTITSVAPPATGTVGVAYNFSVTATGTAPITFTATGLPGGVTISSAGVIAGTPTTAGTFNGTITAANGTLPNATQAFSIVISAGTVGPDDHERGAAGDRNCWRCI